MGLPNLRSFCFMSSGLTGDNVANQSSVGFARIAYDITPNIMIGAFDVDGSCDVQTEPDVVKKHERGYADFKVDYHGIEVKDLYIFAYGMGYQEKLRHLTDIYYLNQ